MGGIDFPLLSDFWPHGAVAKAYGVLREEAGMSERAVFVIDKNGVVKYIDVHDIGEEPDIEQIFEELGKL
jgi:peroxiredoxin (alkyl hydroperoxide reductase subunit C)